MNYLANSVQAEKFIEENHHLVVDIFMEEGYLQRKKGFLSIDVNEEYEIMSFGFQEFDLRKNKYLKINSAPLIKNPSKKIIPVYVQITYEGDLWWCMKKYINFNQYMANTYHIRSKNLSN